MRPLELSDVANIVMMLDASVKGGGLIRSSWRNNSWNIKSISRIVHDAQFKNYA